MKFLQAAVLPAICVGYVIASHLGYVDYDGLFDAFDEGRLDIAVDLSKQNEELGEEGVEYAIERGDSDLIANFVNRTNQANACTLYKLWSNSSIETVERVIEKVDFPQQVLVNSAASYGLAYYPDKFLVLLSKIVKPEDQEKVVEKGIEKLVLSYIDTSPLLNALKGKTFRSERLEYLATQKAFMQVVKRKKVYFLPEDICEHAAITPELYADALIVTARCGKHSRMRRFLLGNADRYDLQAVKKKADYAGLNAEFRDAIEEALKTAAPGGTRTRAYDIQTVEKAEETFEELGSSGIPKDPLSIVNDFVALDAPARRESQIAPKKAPKKVASDVPSTSTEIEGSEDIGSERVGEDQA